MKKKVVVLYGGLSKERNVSLFTGKGVVKALESSGSYEIFPFELTEDIYGFIDFLKEKQPDVVFNALHGTYGEDGHIQALLNLLKVPYTHSGFFASALAFDKYMTGLICQKEGIPMAKSFKIKLKDLKNHLPFDQDKMIKPVADGSSVGVCHIKAFQKNIDQDLGSFLEEEFLVEDYILGREFTVGVHDGQAIAITEIKTSHEFYDYSAKYDQGGSIHELPAQNLTSKEEESFFDYAQKAYKVLGCRGFARADFMMDEKGHIYFLEINTQPGMTPTSLLPEQLAYKNMNYTQLCETMIIEARMDKE